MWTQTQKPAFPAPSPSWFSKRASEKPGSTIRGQHRQNCYWWLWITTRAVWWPCLKWSSSFLPVPLHFPPSPPYGLLSVSDAACYASCWTKMTIDCSATAFVIRLGWILHLNHFIIYVPNSCQCHLEAGWLVIHHTLSFTVVINIVMGWTFTMKLPGEGNVDLLREGQATQNKLCVPVTT